MRRFLTYFAIASVIGGFFLWLAFQYLPFEDIYAWIALRGTRQILWAGIGYLFIYGLCHLTRIWRWSYLVNAVDDGVDQRTILRASALGLTAIFLLPLRLGELVRPYILAEKSSLNMSSLVGTAVVERVFDGLLMTGMLFAGIWLYVGGADVTFVYSSGLVAVLIFVPIAVVCLVSVWQRDWLLQVVESVGQSISRRWSSKLKSFLEQFIDGFEALNSRRYLGLFVFSTIVYWALNVVSMWFLANRGFGLDISLPDMFVVMPILIVGIMIPAGPAQAGNFEFFLGKAMALFLPVAAADIGTRIAAFTAIIHLFQFMVIVGPGLWVMWTDPSTRHLIELAQKSARFDTEKAPDADEAASEGQSTGHPN
jgi:uncharacterized protein (TIRG00374 family)